MPTPLQSVRIDPAPLRHNGTGEDPVGGALRIDVAPLRPNGREEDHAGEEHYSARETDRLLSLNADVDIAGGNARETHE